MLELGFSYDGLAGTKVFTAPDARSCLLQMGIVQPNLVILDLSQSGQERWQTLCQLRERSSVPLIILLAAGDHEDKIRGLDLGADHVLVTPIDFEDLYAFARALLRRAHRVWPALSSGRALPASLVGSAADAT